MAHDWFRLLGAIEAFSVRRAASLIDEDEELRRRRAIGVALSGEEPQRSFVTKGVASKASRGAISTSELTIASILQAPRSSQQGIIALVEALGAERNSDDDDEHVRSAGGGGGSGGASSMVGPVSPTRIVKDRSDVEATSRAAIAAGAQPIVIKVTSTVSSRASAAGLMTYLGTREAEKENGEKGKVDIPIYDQDGLAIASREERATALAAWGADFREAYAVNALATFSITLADAVDDDGLHDALNAAFGSKPFLFARHSDGKVSVYAVTDLSAKKIAGALKRREKGEGPARAVENAEADFARRLADAGVPAEVRILGAAVSEKSGRYFLEKFLRNEKAVTTSEGNAVKSGPGVKEKADGVWRAWLSHIRTVEPRNAFHIIFSARAGTDAEAMKCAVRDFLSEQVAGHRWITAHHPETGHVHVHAIISARDDVGKALRLTKPELYEWRERFAAKAREHGIAMVATRRADLAATRPYGQAQAGAYERGKTDLRYLHTPAVAKRVERKRAGVVDRISLTNGNLALAPKWQTTANNLKKAGAQPSVIAAADRFAAAAVDKVMQAAPQQASGYVLLRIDAERSASRETMAAILQRSAGVDVNFVAASAKGVYVLAPTVASISRLERELAKQNDAAGPGGETSAVAKDVQAKLLKQGVRAEVVIEAAGPATVGSPSPWLQNRFDAVARGAGATPGEQLSEFKSLIATIQQQKDKAMPLSLEQFDERVSRANKSMHRLETMVDSSADRQAVEEMRKEISALFEEQRRDIQMQQMRSVSDTAGGGTPPASHVDEAHAQARPAPTTVDPAITAQQRAIAAGRALRAAREQAGASKAAQDEQRQQILRQAEQDRQRGNDRDGAER
ncbi:relaxase/mobilization nuclease domain-containing protein [Shinella sp. M31]|uniref:relaxase/mobilization nuclease domain-containing protein n=1 Tax=Shinella sp. M31 TaxID=3368615 RepID=UPI003B9E90EA